MGMAETIVPHFHNDLGVPVIEIGAKEFMCVSTLYRRDPSLAPNAARPAECALHDAA